MPSYNFLNPWGPEGQYWNNNALQKNATTPENTGVQSSSQTVRNSSQSSIWCKNESDSSVFELPPGNSTDKSIDGLTHWLRVGEVFKVVDYFESIFGLVVYDEGIAFQTAFFPIEKELNVLGGGGWLSAPPDEGWHLIFEKAGYRP